jgi:hypothetical protein
MGQVRTRSGLDSGCGKHAAPKQEKQVRRQPNGVNFDEGLALQTPEELSLLYVDTHAEEIIRLIEWYKSKEREALLLGGQIGVGKSTLLSALIIHNGCKPDLVFSFDRETPSFSPGGFWGYVLGRLVDRALRNDVTIPDGFAPSDFPEADVADWAAVVRLLTTIPRSVAENDRLGAVLSRIAERTVLIERQCKGILKALEEKFGRPLRICCEGVDKFVPGTPEMQSFAPVLDLLAEFKTVFEVNAVHLFGCEWKWQNAPRVYVPPFEQKAILELLAKRLGLYKTGRQDFLPAITQFSGGNPRQALRLLMAYDHARGLMRMHQEDALGYACRRVRNDYLYLLFGIVPQDVLKAVERDGFIRTGLITGVGMLTPAADAVYKNWLILGTEPEDDERWPVQLNPLLRPAQLIANELPDGPETAAIKRWAERHDVSPYGLDFDTSCKSSAEVFNEISSSSSSMDVLNIVDLLDAVANALFSVNRRDRVLIAYHDQTAMEVARDYLAGKAGEMGFSPVVSIDLETTPEEELMTRLFAMLTDVDGHAIYSIQMQRSPDKAFLGQLDKRRDVFVPYEMLWWVRIEDMALCLQEWPQLRQLMAVYILEDELLGSLNPEEVQGDLDYLAIMEKDKPLQEAEQRFRHVLNVVRERRGS